MSGPRYWHGGAPGLQVGDRILPPSLTNTPWTLVEYADDIEAGVQRRDRIYITSDREVARGYAALHPQRGALYRVEPEGELVPDPDCLIPGLSWEVPSARIVQVVDRCVVLSPLKALRKANGRHL